MKKRFACCLALALCLNLCALPSGAYGPGDLVIPRSAETIVYGHSGYGRDLRAYKFGSGRNVLVAGFCIHGWEDAWAQDGGALVYTAGQLMNLLDANPDVIANGDWTVYILPCMNPDGLYDGYSCSGPGRLTMSCLTSSGQVDPSRGIDMNRSFPTGWRRLANARNSNGTAPLQCLESQALANFIRDVRGEGENVCLDIHGWTGQIITSAGRSGAIYTTLKNAFPGNTHASLQGTPGYFAGYAMALGYDSCLFEFPHSSQSLSEFQSTGHAERFSQCVLCLLRAYGVEPTERPAAVPEGDGPLVTALCSRCGNVTGAGRWDAGAAGTLTANGAVPFQGWYLPDGALLSTDRVLTLTPTEDTTVIALFQGDRFYDVKEGDWYADSVARAEAIGLFRDTDGMAFYGQDAFTRGQAMCLLARLDGADLSPYYAGSSFLDVEAGSETAAAIQWAAQSGLLPEPADGQFHPDAAITREQLVALLVRYLTEYKAIPIYPADLTDWPDWGSVSEYARGSMSIALAIGLVSGVNGELQPQREVTRAEGLTVLLRVDNTLAKIQASPALIV